MSPALATGSTAIVAAIPPATGAAGDLFGEIVPWLAVLAGIVVVGAVAVAVIRRWMRGTDDSEPDGLTLHGLRQLRDRGDLTDEEFEQAKAAIVGAARRAAERPQPDGE